MKENYHIVIQVPLKFVLSCPIDIRSTLVQVRAWHQTDEPLPEPMFTKMYDAIIRQLKKKKKIRAFMIPSYIVYFL